MYEQLNIFLFLQNQEQSYCFDEDINEIHKKLVKIAEKYGTEIGKDEFIIWSHVPQYGYRLWLDMRVTRDNLCDEKFMSDIEQVEKFAKERDIELSCMIGACFFYRGEDTASLSFSTTFMDKKRQKIK